MQPKPTRLLIVLFAAACARAPEPPTPAPLPAPVPPVPPELVTHATADHSCALDALGVVTCWGRNDEGQLGLADRLARRSRIERDARIEMVSVGGRHTCALDAVGIVVCWGANAHGQLGDGDTVARAAPGAIASERRYARVSAGAAHTCALDDAGRAFCWGDNRWGQLGDGSRASARAPVPVASAATFLRLSAGSRHTCGVTSDGRLLCWGDNFLGQLGVPPAMQTASTPVVVALEDSVTRVSAGHGHTCALTVGGAAWCWGQNGIGQIGSGAPPGASAPARVAGTPALADIRVGYHHTCAVDVDGSGWCWGANTASEPGDATVSGQLGAPVSWTNLPLRLERVTDALESTAPGDGHTCVLTRDADVHCFGSNRSGQLGRPEPARSMDPLLVIELVRQAAPTP